MGMLHFELTAGGCAVNIYIYIIYKSGLLQRDFTPSYTANMTECRFEKLNGLEVLFQSVYCPDLAPSVNRYFLSHESIPARTDF